jgi:hypothetical protein
VGATKGGAIKWNIQRRPFWKGSINDIELLYIHVINIDFVSFEYCDVECRYAGTETGTKSKTDEGWNRGELKQ